MVYAVFLNADQQKALRYEVIPPELSTLLTRLLRRKYTDKGISKEYGILYFENEVINTARTLCGLAPYVLRTDDLGEYHIAEEVWHRGELYACLRRFDADELAEFLGDALQNEWFTLHEVNNALHRANLSFRFKLEMTSSDNSEYRFVFCESWDFKAEVVDGAHPNIRLLVERMDRALEDNDYSLVLATSASIMETLAKISVGRPTVQDKPLGSFFSAYRKSSTLPEPILDYVKHIYHLRNTEPLAAHGHLSPPTINVNEASILAEMTKAFVIHEKRMAVHEAAMGRLFDSGQ